MQGGKLLAGSLCQYFYATVMIIAYPPGDTENVGFALDKPTKTDTLNAAADKITLSWERIFAGGHAL